MSDQIPLKTPHQINLMHQGGKILDKILWRVLDEAKTGTKTKDLDNLAQMLIEKYQAFPSFKTVRDYQFSTCITLNEEVVHGLPSHYVLKKGDLLSVDIGILYKGLHTDHAWTILVDSQDKQKERFLKAGKIALKKAIQKASLGKRVGSISKAIQDTLQKFNYQPVKSLTGHGIGRKLHEPPAVPCFLPKNTRIEETPQLKTGMTLAIEVIYSEKDVNICLKGNNHWTIKTKDDSLSALFEHTVAITKKGPIILTKDI